VTDSQEAFATEFAKMSENIEQIYDRLTKAINDIMDSETVSDENKQRYQEMVEQMTKTILNPTNKKISFLTFKIVEETIKRACLRV
jgi:methyl-accepting chemotaxis protein